MTVNFTDRARALRINSTDAERLLWKHLKSRQVCGLKFRRQEQIGYYVVDFVCYEVKLIVEADGGQHAVEKENDNVRTYWLNLQGFRVVRFWNNEILTNIDGVLEIVREACITTPHPNPLPQGERE